MLLSDICLSVVYIGPKSRTERPRKTKIGTEVAHVTRDSVTTLRSKGQKSRSPGRFTHRRVGASGSFSGGRGNVSAVRNCCYVAVCSAPRDASALTREERGGGISWRPPAYSLLFLYFRVVDTAADVSELHAKADADDDVINTEAYFSRSD